VYSLDLVKQGHTKGVTYP